MPGIRGHWPARPGGKHGHLAIRQGARALPPMRVEVGSARLYQDPWLYTAVSAVVAWAVVARFREHRQHEVSSPGRLRGHTRLSGFMASWSCRVNRSAVDQAHITSWCTVQAVCLLCVRFRPMSKVLSMPTSPAAQPGMSRYVQAAAVQA